MSLLRWIFWNSHTQPGAPPEIRSGSDHQWIRDSIAFWEQYDALAPDAVAQHLLWTKFLDAHGMDLNVRKYGYYPPRVNPADVYVDSDDD